MCVCVCVRACMYVCVCLFVATLPSVDVTNSTPEVSYKQRLPLTHSLLPVAVSYSLFQRLMTTYQTTKMAALLLSLSFSPSQSLTARPNT